MGVRSAIYILLIFPLLAKGRVTGFTSCSQFFKNGVPPTILTYPANNNRYKQICQCLLDNNQVPQYFYATLYDTTNRIPVYSAYQIQYRSMERDDSWNVEPQLDGGTNVCMSGLNQIPTNNRGVHQALNTDYTNSGYDKGHLYPVFHTSNQFAMKATFTLTNAAPQAPGFNRGQWRVHEENLAILLLSSCASNFVVTGVVPAATQINSRVSVARFYWNAYCCINPGQPNESAGFLGPNNNGNVDEMTLNNLETRLTGYYGSLFSVFQGTC